MKKSRWKLSTRLLSVILVLAFCICQIPLGVITVAAAENPVVATPEQQLAPETVRLEPTVVAEDVAKREASVKHFRLSDGTYRAVQYDVPVHFMQGDGWVDYDNTLTEVESEEVGNLDFVNTKADYEVRLSKKTNGKKWVRLEKDGYKISWYYVDGAKSTGVTTTATDDGDLTTLEKVTSTVTYADVFDGVDLRYRVGPTGLKEDLILKKSGTRTVFTAEYNIDKLTAEQTDEHTIELRDADGVVVYTLSAPYMTDAKGAVSKAMTYKIISTKNKRITVELTADADWLSDAAREFPVTVDPSVVTGVDEDAGDRVISASVSSGQPNTSLGESSAIQVGVDVATDETKSLLKMSELPRIGDNAVVVASYLYLTRLVVNQELEAQVERITEDWDADDVTWNTLPSIASGQIMDIQAVVQPASNAPLAERLTVWNITSAAEQWYREVENYGIMISGAEGNSGFAAFCSHSYFGEGGIRPYITIDYRNMTGLENYWSYTGVNAGRSGSAVVNLFNGNLVVTQPVISSAGGNVLPVSFSLVYNSNQYAASAYGSSVGLGWRTNYNLRIIKPDLSSDGTVEYYIFVDSDGTQHAFRKESGQHYYRDEDGLGYTLTVHNDGTYVLEDKADTTINFNADGLVTEIADVKSQKITFTYEETLYNGARLKTITDDASRVYTLTYYTSDSLNIASIKDPSNRVTGFEYDDDNTNLQAIVFPDGKRVEMTYNTTGRLATIQANDGSRVSAVYHYKSHNVMTLSRSYKQEDDSYAVDERYTFQYVLGRTTITDRLERDTTYTFDHYGQTQAVVSSAQQAGVFYEYEDRTINPLKANKLSQESRVQSAIINLLKNPRLDADASGYTAISSGSSNYGHSWDGTKGHTANGSLKVYRGDITSTTNYYTFYNQQFVVDETGYYTFSGYVNTNNQLLVDQGAQLRLERWDGEGTTRYQVNSAVVNETESDEWRYVSVTMYVHAGELLKCLVGTCGPTCTGTMWFDDLQLEFSAVPNTFNLLQNTNFDNGYLGWTASSGVSTTSLTAFKPGPIDSAVKINGAAGSVRRATQNVKISGGKKGDVYSAGTWAKAFSVPVSAEDLSDLSRAFGIHIAFYHNGSVVGVDRISGGLQVFYGQMIAGEIIAPADYDEIRFSLEYNYNANTAYFTRPYLYRENYGISYVYDDAGNPISVEDLAEQESTFAYQDDQLVNVLNPTGSRYMYGYTPQKQVEQALSSDGVMYDLEYNEDGNIESATTYAFTYVTDLEENTKYMLVNAGSSGAIDSTAVGTESGANLCLGTNLFDITYSNVHWSLDHISNGSYYIKEQGNSNGSWYLSVLGGNNYENQGVSVNISAADAAKRWRFVPQADGTFVIFTELSGETRCLSTYKEDEYAATQVVITSYDEEDVKEEQKWYVYPTTVESEYRITSSIEYTDDGVYPSSVTDTYGNTTYYDYDTTKGVLDSLTDALNHQTLYAYNADNDRLEQVSIADESVQYTYDDGDRLTKISLNNVPQYEFIYDNFGRTAEVKVIGAGTPYTLSQNTYDAYGRLTRQTYGNDGFITYTYDNLDRVSKKVYNNRVGKTLEYYYDAFGRLSAVLDTAENTTTRYRYDLSGRLAEELLCTGANLSSTKVKGSTAYNYTEETSQLASESITTPMGSSDRTYTYGDLTAGQMPDAVYEVSSSNSLLNGRQEKIAYTYDEFGRIATRTVYLNVATGLKKTTTYTYRNEVVNGVKVTGTQVATETTDGVTTAYEYDAIGNIVKISKNNVTYEEYTYDALNQLTKVVHYNADGTKDTYEYEYDGTNLSETKKNGVTVNTYEYNDATWKDRLTSFNGYLTGADGLGNPYLLNGRSFEWDNGRLPTKVTGNKIVTFTYTADGARLTKTVGTATKTYHYIGGMLYGEKTHDTQAGYDSLIFLYDESGSPYGYLFNNAAYYYEKNVLGDVIGIWNANGVKIANYTYDAWGKILSITDQNGNDVSGQPRHQANLNPIRYRGYYYDTEMELYWLTTRFYDPEVGRFVNADTAVGQVGDIHGTNMFSYCFNNPINMSDSTGNWPRLSSIFAAVAVVAITVAVVAAVVVTCAATVPAMAVVGGGVVGSTSVGAISAVAAVGSTAVAVAEAATVASVTTYAAEKAVEKTVKKDNSVYVLKDEEGTVQYVGRTNNVAKREAAHNANPARAGLEMEVIASGLNLPEARALEQAAMSYYHTINTTNKMNNQINGISPKYWGAFKELAIGTLNYGWNQMSNEILYWTGN